MARGNGIGVLVTGDQNGIGGSSREARNLISGNAEEGIRIKGPDVIANVVLGNYVGTSRGAVLHWETATTASCSAPRI